MDEDYVNNSHTQINVPPRDDRTPNNLSQPVCQNCSYPFDACDCVELEKFAKDLSKIISKKSNDDSEGKLQSIICDNCKEELEMLPDVLERLGIDSGILKKKGVKNLYKGRGCSRCNDTGYYGRVGILETLLIDDPIRDMIMKKASSDQIKEYAIKEKHMMTLRDNAFENCMKGVTTLEETLRVTSED